MSQLAVICRSLPSLSIRGTSSSPTAPAIDASTAAYTTSERSPEYFAATLLEQTVVDDETVELLAAQADHAYNDKLH